MPVTEAGYWPLIAAYCNTLYMTLCLAPCACLMFTAAGVLYIRDCIFFHSVGILFSWLHDFLSSIGLIHIFKTQPHAGRQTVFMCVCVCSAKGEIQSLFFLCIFLSLCFSQEVWKWRASTWPSRRESCARRCCCWARPSRTPALKSKFMPESWVSLPNQTKW